MGNGMSSETDQSDKSATGDAPIGILTVLEKGCAGTYLDQGGPGILAAMNDYLTTPWRPTARIVGEGPAIDHGRHWVGVVRCNV